MGKRIRDAVLFLSVTSLTLVMCRELEVPRLGLGFRAWDGDALRSAAMRLNGLGFRWAATR